MLKVNGNIECLKPYEPGKTIEEIKREYNLENIVKLASNENSFGTSPKAVEAIKNYAEKAYLYADGSCFKLKEKISKKLNISFEQLIIGNGSNEIIELILRTFIDKGDKIISCFPTFSFYRICAETTFGSYLDVPLLNYLFDLNKIYENIDSSTKVIIICNPNNPTGTVVGKNEFESFIDNIPDDLLVVLDEAYIEFVQENKRIDAVKLIEKYPNKNIIILRTFSKIYGLASLRIGYGISNEKIVNYLNRVRQPFNVNGFAQIAALAALEDSDFLEKTLNGVKKGKEYIYKEFNRLKIDYLESETNFIFFKLNYNNEEVFKKFLKKGIIIRSLKSFGYDNALRVTIGTMEENKKFIDELENILKELQYEKS